MRCSCKACGTYMVQREQGLNSGCKCPDCGEECHDCMGSRQGPMDPEQLKTEYLARLAACHDAEEEDEYNG